MPGSARLGPQPLAAAWPAKLVVAARSFGNKDELLDQTLANPKALRLTAWRNFERAVPAPSETKSERDAFPCSFCWLCVQKEQWNLSAAPAQRPGLAATHAADGIGDADRAHHDEQRPEDERGPPPARQQDAGGPEAAFRLSPDRRKRLESERAPCNLEFVYQD
jgi:hypothetical protein